MKFRKDTLSLYGTSPQVLLAKNERRGCGNQQTEPDSHDPVNPARAPSTDPANADGLHPERRIRGIEVSLHHGHPSLLATHQTHEVSPVSRAAIEQRSD